MLGIRSTAHHPHHASTQTCLGPRHDSRRRCSRRPAWPVLLLALIGGSLLGTVAAKAGEPTAVRWHVSLEKATAAAETSGRQVLVLCTATWSPASTHLRKHVLTDPDAAALLAACFEPVLIDIDDDPETTESLGVRHVPGACLVAGDGAVISRFECPSSTGLFIATVARQLQRAPPGETLTAPTTTIAGTVTVVAEEPELANDFSTAGSLLADDAATGPTTESGSIGQIAAKVRGLSDFATTKSPPMRQVAAVPPVAAGSPRAAAAAAPPEVASQPAATAPSVPAVAAATPNRPWQQADTAAVPRQPVETSPAPVTQQPAQPATPPAAEIAVATAAATSATPAPPQTAALPERRIAIDHQPAAWAARRGDFPETAAEPAPLHPWQAEQSPAVSSATPAITGGLIEPQGEADPAAPTGSPWLQPAPQPQSAAVARTAVPPAPQQTVPASPGQLAAPPAGQLAAAAPQPARPATEAPAAARPTPEKQPAKQPNPVLAAITNPFGLFKQNQEVAQPTEAEPKPEKKTATARYASRPVTDSQPAEQNPMPLGLEGYCPVTLVESGSWVEGQAGWGARHRGRTYLFRGLEEQQAFLADPDRYAPALSGDDPVAAFDSGSSLPGERRYGVTYQQRIYLFASPESRATFAANPQRYTSRVQLAEQPTDVGTGDTVLR